MSVLLLSGGLDSAVLLGKLRQEGQYPYTLSIDYGQKHQRELIAAISLAHFYRVPHQTICLPSLLFSGSALTGTGEIPQGGITLILNKQQRLYLVEI